MGKLLIWIVESETLDFILQFTDIVYSSVLCEAAEGYPAHLKTYNI